MTGAGIRLRPMRWWDLPRVLALEAVAFAEDPPWTAAQFWSELALVPASRAYLVAVDGPDRVVGYAGLAVGVDGSDVQTIAVAPERRRAGLGSRLLAELIEEAEGRRATPVRLEVRADDTGAQAFYRRHGFVAVHRRRGYYAAGGPSGGAADALVLERRRRP